MRAEDRKPSKRVFPLLQNVDLDSVTFANVQGVGDPISIEDMNEQEMQDLVLVNLARLAVAGEWTGLLEAGGGGGGGQPAPVAAALDTTGTNYARWPVSSQSSNNVSSGNNKHYTILVPFIAPISGALDEIGILTNGTGAIEVYAGIYTNHPDLNTPKTLMGFSTFDVSSVSGAMYAVPGDTITLVKGTTYWAAWTTNSTGTAVNVDYVGAAYQWTLWPLAAPPTASLTAGCLQTVSNETALASQYTPDEIEPGAYGSGIPVMTVAYA